MKKIVFILTLLFCPNLFAATLTANNVPYACQGGSTPQLCNSNITNTSTNVGIGTTAPAYALDVGGTIGNSSGDLASVPWQNYSSISTISGWSSFSVASIYTKKIGKTVFVQFVLYGTSNSTSVYFTLPYTNGNTSSPVLAQIFSTNGSSGMNTVGLLEIPSNSATAYCYVDINGDPFAAYGTKVVQGEFWYQST